MSHFVVAPKGNIWQVLDVLGNWWGDFNTRAEAFVFISCL